MSIHVLFQGVYLFLVYYVCPCVVPRSLLVPAVTSVPVLLSVHVLFQEAYLFLLFQEAYLFVMYLFCVSVVPRILLVPAPFCPCIISVHFCPLIGLGSSYQGALNFCIRGTSLAECVCVCVGGGGGRFEQPPLPGGVPNGLVAFYDTRNEYKRRE